MIIPWIALTCLASVILTGAWRWFSLKIGIIDLPNARNTHQMPVARSGGIGFIVPIVAFSLYLNIPPSFKIALVISLVVALVGLWDDIKNLTSVRRLVIQFLCAIATIGWTGISFHSAPLPYFIVPFGILGSIASVLWIAGLINIMNFMDGIDGYAASMTVIGGLTLSYFFHQAGLLPESYFLLIFIASVAGFLFWNYPKAKIFMGDVGSTFLGFWIAIAILVLCQANPNYLVPSIMLFSVFIFDAITTFIKRIYRKEDFLKAHCEHYFQLLYRSGWTHRKILYLEISHMLLCAVASVAYTQFTELGQLLLIIGMGSTFILKYYLISKTFHAAQASR